MYKLASRNLQRAHSVDRAAVGSFEDDVIASADNLGEQECKAELAQLMCEIVRIQNELAIAKRNRDAATASFLGHQEQALIRRRMPIKRRLNELNNKRHGEILGDVVREMLEPELAKQIFTETNRRFAEGGA